MQNDVGYQGPGYVGDTHEPEAGSEKRSGGVSIPTVLASAGVAAVISAIVVTIGVVGIVVSERNDTASAAQPTVVNLGSAQAPQQQGLVGPAATQQPLTWADLDVDKDGSLSKEEVTTVPALTQVFDDADADADGKLTAEEYKAHAAAASDDGDAADDSGQ